ncbi:hypothetical protein GGI21_001099 [Coemansia aciculifera]|nr:hypothetical protein GGI21_001099 [Coemansia aciculifera]
MAVALGSTQTSSAGLIRWSERVERLASKCGKQRRAPHVGVIYADGLEAQAALVTSTNSISVSAAAEQESNALADWIFDCDRIVIVADSAGIVQTLVGTESLRQCLELHPATSLVLNGLDTSNATVTSFSELLRETLSALGLPVSALADVSGWVTPADAFVRGDNEAMLLNSLSISSATLLASAMRAAILCAEHGGSAVFAPVNRRLDSLEAIAAAASGESSSLSLTELLGSIGSENADTLSPSSKRLQDSFVNNDLLSVDSSNGSTKHRIRTWFASGSIWKALLMRVDEMSDSLIDSTIHERLLEEAELGMIHAAGRLNEYIRYTASELASGLDRLHQGSALKVAGEHTDAELVSARDALRALAAQSEAVDKLVLARLVWKAREKLTGADDCMDGIPRYIRWSLAQSCAINVAAVAGAVTSVLYFNSPTIYAVSGGLSLSLLALAWLGRRWRVLEANLYRHLDARFAALRTDLVNTHRQALLDRVDRPLQACTKRLTAAFVDPNSGRSLAGNAVASATVAAWKSRLAAITA